MDNTKPSNPKDIVGVSKTPFSVIPIPVLWELGLAMLEGALKYGRHNYRVVGVRASVYFDACVARHMASWWEGEDIDPDSGVHHITKAIASLVVLRDAMIRGTWVDDRPPKSDPELIVKANDKVRTLLAKYPDPKAPYTEKLSDLIDRLTSIKVNGMGDSGDETVHSGPDAGDTGVQLSSVPRGGDHLEKPRTRSVLTRGEGH